MTRFGWTVAGMVVAILVCGIALLMWLYGASRPEATSVVVEEPELTLDPASLAIYTSGTYGFSFFYPATAVLVDAFGADAANEWRERAAGRGTLIVEVATTEGEIRLGASDDAEELAACTEPATTETSAGIAQVSSTTWNVFTSSLVGTDAERDVRSYRTVRNGQCYALEAFLAPGVTLQDSSGPSLILESFTFVD